MDVLLEELTMDKEARERFDSLDKRLISLTEAMYREHAETRNRINKLERRFEDHLREVEVPLSQIDEIVKERKALRAWMLRLAGGVIIALMSAIIGLLVQVLSGA